MKTKQITLGLLVIIAGALVLLSNINLGPFPELLSRWWPVFVVALGIYSFWENPRSFAWPLFVVAVGAVLLVKTLGLASISIGALILPLILFGIGLNILLAASWTRKRMTTVTDEHITAVLGGASSKNGSEDYTGGSVTAILGGVELDLTKATIKKDAVLRVSVLMGGIELRVAENVVIKKRTQSILGGIEDKTRAIPSKSAPVLVVEGPIIMGGIEVKR